MASDVSFLREEREDVSGKGISYFGQRPSDDPPTARALVEDHVNGP